MDRGPFAIIVLGAFLAGAAGGLTAWQLMALRSSAMVANDQRVAPSLASLAPLVDEVRPTVVALVVARGAAQHPVRGQRSWGPWFLAAPSNPGGSRLPQPLRDQPTGSGVLISSAGEILTALHIVEGSRAIRARLVDGRELSVKVIGRDPWMDLALLKIEEGGGFPAARLGDSGRLRVGDWVIALGYPFGLGLAATTGVVSATGQIIGHGPYDDFIQTDAAGNPGDSGGPLFNLEGRLVGIHSAGWDGGQGISFAVPINTASASLEQLRDRGRVSRGWLGVLAQFPIPGSELPREEEPGVRVERIAPGSPAAQAGLRPRDRVLAVNSEAVRDPFQLARLTSRLPVGSSALLTIRRGGVEQAIQVRVAELPPTPPRPAR